MTIAEINHEIETLQNNINNSSSILNEIRGRLISNVGLGFKDQIQKCIEVRVKEEFPKIIIDMAPEKQKELKLKMRALQQDAEKIIQDLFEKQGFLKNSETPNYYYSYMIEQELESGILEYASVNIGKILDEFGYIESHDYVWQFNEKADGYTKHMDIDDEIKALIAEYAAENTKLSTYVSKINSFSNHYIFCFISIR